MALISFHLGISSEPFFIKFYSLLIEHNHAQVIGQRITVENLASFKSFKMCVNLDPANSLLVNMHRDP